jgi:hypothetical protein
MIVAFSQTTLSNLQYVCKFVVVMCQVRLTLNESEINIKKVKSNVFKGLVVLCEKLASFAEGVSGSVSQQAIKRAIMAGDRRIDGFVFKALEFAVQYSEFAAVINNLKRKFFQC